MDSVCLVNTMKDCGTDMDNDLQAFEQWWLASKYNQIVIPTDNWKQIAKDAWEAAIKYEQDKPIRTYRWNGVLP